MTVARPLRVSLSRTSGGVWTAVVDVLDRGGRTRRWDIGHAVEEDGQIDWLLDCPADMPEGLGRPELEAAIDAEARRLDRHGYTRTDELDRDLRGGVLHAASN